MKIKQKIRNLTEAEEKSLTERLVNHSFRDAGCIISMFGIDHVIKESRESVKNKIDHRDLCVIMGDALIRSGGFQWVVVEGIHGTDIAVRYGDSSVLIFPRLLVAKAMDESEGKSASDLLFDVLHSHYLIPKDTSRLKNQFS